MAWNDLTIAQRSQMMNLMRNNGISSLSEMKRIYDNAFSSIVERPDPYLQYAQAPVYGKGGHLFGGETEPTQWKKYNGEAVTLERYKELQRQAIIDAAVKKALTRTTGIAPIVDGIPMASCLYTATDNFGPKYRVAYNPELMAHPEKYGWEVAGPLTQDMLGYLYIMSNKNGVWDHGNLITGYDDNGNALISYSQGHAGGKPAPTREEWEEVAKTQRAFNGVAESYEDYVARMAKINSPEADYKRNKRIWDTPGYETLRFIGTPDDNARWEEEFNSLEGYNTEKLKPRILNSEVRLFEMGGPEKENFQVRDNTRVNSIAPQQTGYIPAMDRPLPKDLGEARWDSGVSGVLPFVGDGLQALQAVRDFKSHDWVTGLQTAGLLLAPNIIEKPLKGIFSSSLKSTTSSFDKELFKMIEQDAYRDVLAGRMPAIPVPKENLGKVMAMPEDVKRVLWNSTLPRLKATHTDVDVDALWNKAMGRATYTEYPAETYAKAGEGWAAGHYNPDTGNIGMKEGSPHMAVLPHEGRHRLDAKIPLTEEESGILNDAFGQEFLDLPNTVPELKGYNSILRDEVTTNADARMKLLGEVHSQRTPPELQNIIIAKKTDEQIVKAMEESNFYGRKLIENLRASGKLTPERINKFRIAMQKVGAVAGVGYLGNYLYNTDEEPANPIGFGVLQPGEYASGGHKIHIKKANRGKFTALKKRTGHSASWFKAHGTPAQKKMAVFALNAKKWKHSHGGIKF